MSRAVVEVGDKLHIVTRRLFEEDMRRHFLGEVAATSDTLTEVRGFTFLFQPGTNEYVRLPAERTRIFSLGDSGFVVNKLPRDVEIDAVVYRTVKNRLVISDGRSFSLPINEFGVSR